MLKRVIYVFLSKVLGYLIKLALPYVLVRVLITADYGVYRQFFLIETFIATLFQFGINQSLYYFIPRDNRNAGSYFLNSLSLNVVIFAGIFLIIYFFNDSLSVALNMPVLTRFFTYLALFTLLLMLNVASDIYLLARQLAKQSAFFEIVGNFVDCTLPIMAALLTHDLGDIMLSMVLAKVFRLAMYLGYIHFKLHGFAAHTYFTGIWPQVRYGLVLGIGGTFWSLMFKMHELIANKFYGIEDYAMYSVGSHQLPFLRFYLLSIVSVSLGQFTTMIKENDWAGATELWNKILASLYGITIPVAIGFLVLTKPFIIFMFTEEYAGAVDIFRVNVLTWIHLLWNAQLILRAMNRNDITVYNHLAHLIVAPFLLYFGMKLFGLMGIISAHCILLISARLVSVIFLNRASEMRLAYAPSPSAVWEFYREIYSKGREWLGELGGRRNSD
ncbi:MAG: oligosaccharide flippase family protein [bacterium]